MKKLLAGLFALFTLALVLPAEAGVHIIDGSSNSVFTDLPGSGSLGALNAAVTLTLRGQGTVTVQVVSVSATQTLAFEGTVDNVNWFALNAVVIGSGAIVTTTTAAGQWTVDVSSLVGFRVRCSAYTSGTASVFVNAALQSSVIGLDTPLPTGTNVIGAITQSGNWTDRVVGNVGGVLDAANNAAAPANVLVAGVQLQSGATATAGTAGQVGSPVAGLDHVLYARIGGPVTWSWFVEAVPVMTQCRAAPAAGIRAYVTSMACSNEAATANNIDVTSGTGANCATGTTALTHKFTGGTLATTTSPFVIQHTFSSPLTPTAANAVCVRPSAATAFGCTLTGYDAP